MSEEKYHKVERENFAVALANWVTKWAQREAGKRMFQKIIRSSDLPEVMRDGDTMNVRYTIDFEATVEMCNGELHLVGGDPCSSPSPKKSSTSD